VGSSRSKSEGRASGETIRIKHRIGTDTAKVKGSSFDKHSHISQRYVCLYSISFVGWVSL